MTLTLGNLQDRVERLLQDTANRRWTVAEINDYIFDAQHEFVRLTGYPLYTQSVSLQGLVAEYDVPTDLMDIQRARVRNRAVEIPIISPTVLDESSSFLHEPVDADWRSQTGPIRAIVLDHQSAPTFRLYPIPAGDIVKNVTASFPSGSTTLTVSNASDLKVGMYVGGNSSIPENTAVSSISGTEITINKTTTGAGADVNVTFVSSNVFSTYLLQVPTTDVDSVSGTDLLFTEIGGVSVFMGTTVVLPSIELQGTRNPPRNALQNYANVAGGTDTPIIGSRFHEALVFGAVERAYLKENELRNVQKSNVFRERFLQFVAEARREERENRIRRVGGANRVRMKVSRRWV